MWLIDVENLTLQDFVPPNVPPYAILLHTWEGDEVTFQDFAHLTVAKSRDGWTKIRKTCELAAAAEISYTWVDTCCIDKTWSAELSEAINSMFDWYKQSTICSTYLSDLEAQTDSAANLDTLWLDERRQHKCLQELLAPKKLQFFDAEWKSRGFKTNASVMRQLSAMTGIRGPSTSAFRHSETIFNFAVAKRRSTISGLLVNMPMLYGEGHRAFQRLQEEIIKNSTDMSLCCWQAPKHDQSYRGLLAHCPAEFISYYLVNTKSRKSLGWTLSEQEKEYTVTNKGIRLDAELLSSMVNGLPRQLLRCTLLPDHNVVNIVLRHYRDNIYVRELPYTVTVSDSTDIRRKVIYIAKDVDERLSDNPDP